jgi:hypothetical protein
MAKFVVEFDPPLPKCAPRQSPRLPDWPTVHSLSKGHGQYRLTYIICGERWSYDGADLTTILHDLVSEMDALEDGGTHDVLMSGYPVLAATISGGRIRYFDRSEWSAELSVSEANAGLTAGADLLWGFIMTSSGQHLD